LGVIFKSNSPFTSLIGELRSLIFTINIECHVIFSVILLFFCLLPPFPCFLIYLASGVYSWIFLAVFIFFICVWVCFYLCLITSFAAFNIFLCSVFLFIDF
jgi:hypothetical protein